MEDLDYERLEAIWEQMKSWYRRNSCPPALAKLIRERIEPPYTDLMPLLSPKRWHEQIGPLVTMAFLAGYQCGQSGDFPIESIGKPLTKTDCASMHTLLYREYTIEGDE